MLQTRSLQHYCVLCKHQVFSEEYNHIFMKMFFQEYVLVAVSKENILTNIFLLHLKCCFKLETPTFRKGDKAKGAISASLVNPHWIQLFLVYIFP